MTHERVDQSSRYRLRCRITFHDGARIGCARSTGPKVEGSLYPGSIHAVTENGSSPERTCGVGVRCRPAAVHATANRSTGSRHACHQWRLQCKLCCDVGRRESIHCSFTWRGRGRRGIVCRIPVKKTGRRTFECARLSTRPIGRRPRDRPRITLFVPALATPDSVSSAGRRSRAPARECQSAPESCPV